MTIEVVDIHIKHGFTIKMTIVITRGYIQKDRINQRFARLFQCLLQTSVEITQLLGLQNYQHLGSEDITSR